MIINVRRRSLGAHDPMAVILGYGLHDAGRADCGVEIGADRSTATAAYLVLAIAMYERPNG